MSRVAAIERWEELRARLDRELVAAKLSPAVTVELSEHYAALPAADRSAIDGLLAQWVLSPEESKRFDALALIDEHRIATAVPALRELRSRLDASRDVGAGGERTKVDRVLATLAAGSPTETR